MRRRGNRLSPFVVGLVAIVLISAITYVGFTKSIPFVGNPYEVQASFRDTSGLSVNAPVRIAGVEVGKVASVEHTAPGAQSATVTMNIEDNGRPLKADAAAKIRPRIFLEGNFFVDLSPGTPSAPEMPDGGTIPAERTSNAVQFDQLLAALKSDTRGETQLSGGGQAFNDSLEFQPDAYRFSAVVSEALLGEGPGDLGDWIRDQGVVAAALDRDPEQLKALIRNFNTTAGALADREGFLRAAVRELPVTLRTALPAFDALNDAFPSVRRFAVDAQPGIRSTGPAVEALVPLLRQARGLVGPRELRGLSRDLRAATPALTRLARDTVPVLEQLRELAGCTNTTLVPFGNSSVGDPNFPASGPAHQELPKSLVGLAGESRSFDANGQFFKTLGTGGLETFNLGNGLFGTTTSPIVGVNPPPVRERPPLRPDVACETQENPDLRSIPQDGPESVNTRNDSPEVIERTAKAREVALELAERRLARNPLTEDIKVLDRDTTLADIQGIARRNGLTSELRQTLERQKP
jgi:virulence factor Mce-like protein